MIVPTRVAASANDEVWSAGIARTSGTTTTPSATAVSTSGSHATRRAFGSLEPRRARAIVTPAKYTRIVTNVIQSAIARSTIPKIDVLPGVVKRNTGTTAAKSRPSCDRITRWTIN